MEIHLQLHVVILNPGEGVVILFMEEGRSKPRKIPVINDRELGIHTMYLNTKKIIVSETQHELRLGEETIVVWDPTLTELGKTATLTTQWEVERK
jgi:hypothetical protein